MSKLRRARQVQKQNPLTADEAVKAFGFKDAQALDIFSLQLDAMALLMYEKKIEDKPAIVKYIDTHFRDNTEKILAAMFAGAKITENAWITATTGVK